MMEEKVQRTLLLQEAINAWDPQKPRRWLARYGGINSKGIGALGRKYCQLRYIATLNTQRKNMEAANGIASHLLWVDL